VKQVLRETQKSRLKNVSKDDHLFGVRAVDRDGNEGLTTFPRPATQRQMTSD